MGKLKKKADEYVINIYFIYYFKKHGKVIKLNQGLSTWTMGLIPHVGIFSLY
jgi:hypothetical protein